MKFAVKVWMKDSVLDTQGRAVSDLLKRQEKPVQDVKIGKWILLELNLSDKKQALEQAHDIAKTLLHNPLIEQYSIEEVE